jgi:hypothetical protein
MPHSPRPHGPALAPELGRQRVRLRPSLMPAASLRSLLPELAGWPLPATTPSSGCPGAREPQFPELGARRSARRQGCRARCGLLVVDPTSRGTLAWVRLEEVVRESYDVAMPPGMGAPAAVGLKTDEITRLGYASAGVAQRANPIWVISRCRETFARLSGHAGRADFTWRSMYVGVVPVTTVSRAPWPTLYQEVATRPELMQLARVKVD